MIRIKMADLFIWQNILFYISIAFGSMLALSSAFGFISETVSEGDTDAASGPLGNALSILGIGRIPLTIVLMISSLIFGGTGLILNLILSDMLDETLAFCVALPASIISMLVLTNISSRALSKILPTTESYEITRMDLIGALGKAITFVDKVSGVSNIKDKEGNIHAISCYSSMEDIPSGSEVVVVSFDDLKKKYVITKFE